MKKQFIDTKRGRFHYREFGNAKNPSVVMLHGWPQSGRCWEEVAVQLENDFHLIAPDLRGLGDSNRELKKELYVKEELAKDMIALVDELGIEKFHLAGHDWGGGVAQEIGFLVPERIQKFALLNFPIINNPVGQTAAYKILGKRLFAPFWYQVFMNMPNLSEALIEGKEEVWIRFTHRGMVNPIPEDAVQEYVRCYQIPGSLTTGANYYRTMRFDYEKWNSPEFAQQKHPFEALIIHGNKDQVIVKEYFEGRENCFDKVDIKSVEAGHFVMDEKPDDVAKLLREFWG